MATCPRCARPTDRESPRLWALSLLVTSPRRAQPILGAPRPPPAERPVASVPIDEPTGPSQGKGSRWNIPLLALAYPEEGRKLVTDLATGRQARRRATVRRSGQKDGVDPV